MQKTTIQDKNPASCYGIYVTEYVLCNKVEFQSTQIYETQKTQKIISPIVEARCPGSKSRINNLKKIHNIRYGVSVLKYLFKISVIP